MMKNRFTNAGVNAIIILAAWLLIPMSLHAESWQEISASAFTNAEIVWQVPSNALPQTLWVYRRLLPRVFAASVISNAVVLGSLEKRGFPKSSTNDFFISQEVSPDWPAPIPTLLGIVPKDAYLYFSIPSYAPLVAQNTPDDKTILLLAIKDALLLGLSQKELTRNNFYTHWSGTEASGSIFGRGVFFPRQLEGISFFSAASNGDGAEGFSIEFGEHGKIQAFSVRWSDLQHYKSERIATTGELTRCIRAHKAIVMPNFKDNDFAWLKSLTKAKRLTIIKITPYYGEGIFGEIQANDIPCQYATPFVELEAVADIGDAHIPVKIVSPILSPEVARLLKL